MTLPVPAEIEPTPRRAGPRRRTVTLARTLAVAIGGLVAIAVAAVLAIYWTTTARTTFDLLTNQAEIGVASVEARLRQHLEPVSNELGSLALMLQQGRLDPGDAAQFSTMLTGALSASPQVQSIAYLTEDMKIHGVSRQPDGTYYPFDNPGDPKRSEEALADASAKVDAYWGEILYLDDGPHATVLNLRQPVRRNGQLVGLLFAVVTVQDLSKFLARVSSDPSQVPFILYGEDRVLAHPRMAVDPPPASVAEPLPRLDQVGDPLLAALWSQGSPVTVRNPRVRIREVETGDYDELFLYRTIYGFGPTPLILGIHVPGDAIGAEVQRVIRAGLAGLAVMVLAIIVGVFVGRMIARPVRAFSDQARAVGTLEFSKLKPLPGSIFKELNEGAQAFNTMLVGLRWLETYVPKSLVRRLIIKGDGEDVVSIERILTVMFTDIANFSGAAERLPAARIAAFLNEHFAILARSIEAESGTIDKFIGDCLMAFWGAPEKMKDHAPRAARAALAIAAAMRIDNDRRSAAGRPRLRLRIGLHSGPVVVGNIGAPGRTNYTIVGDTVNIGNRLEQLGKVLSRDEETTILISAETAALLGPEFEMESLGPRRVRGRNGEVEIFRLTGLKPTV
jgi:adenylate cyclase